MNRGSNDITKAMNTVSLDELAQATCEHFGIPPGDYGLFPTIVKHLRILSHAESIDAFAPFLEDEEHPVCLWRLKWPVTYCLREKHFKVFKPGGGFTPEYCAWVEGYGRALVSLARITKDYDPWIQQMLNHEDFLFYELRNTDDGKTVVCEFYDLRGIDFFLVHYMGGTMTAVSDKALFDSARLVPECLRAMAREEEAVLVGREIDQREKRLKEILAEYSPPHAASFSGTLECLRLLAERFWVDYLSSRVWCQCSEVSRQDLIDAFVAEYMLQKGVLRGWSQAVLTLCKVIEREMATVFFTPWVTVIQSASFAPPNGLSKSQSKRVQSRQVTFQILQGCARKPSHPPTLGQLLFVAKFWRDSVMDQCTDMLRQMREEAERHDPEFTDMVGRVVELCEEPHEVDGEHPTVTDLRNAAAHPGRESDFTWPEYVGWLKDFLGKPPRQALQLLIQMREVLKSI